MKKIILVFTLLLAFLASVAHAKVLPPDIAKILQSGVLRVGVVPKDAPPFTMLSPAGTVEGYDIEMTKDIGQKLGVKVVFKTADTFDNLVEMVNDNQVDIATNITPTLARAQFTIFSHPYIIIKLVFFANRLALSRQNVGPNNIRQLNNPKYRIGVAEGSAYHGVLKEFYPQAVVIPYKDLHQALDDAIEGKLIAVFLDEPHIKTWLRSHQQANLYGEVLDSGTKLPVTLAVSWENVHLLRWLDTYLDTIKMDGTWEQWMKKYFLEPM